MTRADLVTALGDLIEQDGEEQYIRLATFPDESVLRVSVARFLEMFGTIDLDYASLAAADNGRGYTPYFAQWKEQGLIR